MYIATYCDEIDGSICREKISIDEVKSLLNADEEELEINAALAYEILSSARPECVDVIEEKDFILQEKEEERNRLERLAANLAAKNNLVVHSSAFLDYLYGLLQSYETYREGMKEDRLCIGYGVTPDAWIDEYNSSVVDSVEIGNLFGWMVDNLPLLTARWKEERSIEL